MKKDLSKPNGCGPSGWPDLIPDGPDGLFKSPCDEHDELYEIGGGWKEKHYADFRMFYRCVENVKNSYKNRANRILGYLCAFAYLIGVLAFGFIRFNFKRKS
jgi:hypothetical protein